MRRSPMLVVLISLLTLAVSAPRALPAAEQTGQPAGVTAAKDSDGVELPAFGKKKDKEEPKPPAGPGPGKKDEPAFEEVVKDSEKIDGLFTVYKKDDRYLIEIKPDQMDKDFMISVTRETGIAQLFDGVQMLVDNPVRFHKVGKRVQLLLANNRFEAMGDPDVKRAVEKSFSPSLIGSSKIESEPHPDRKSVLIDLAPLLLTDVEGVGPFLAQAMQSPCGLDRENSDVTRVLGFPLNMEMEARLHFSAASKPLPFTTLPDSRSMFMTYRYSLSTVPAAAGFIPRIADDRVGHFLAMYEDFSDDTRETPYVRYAARWNLQKAEPYAALSKPVEPITFWLENSIPKQYRKAIADGILVWNTAFEKIGFKDAVVVKQQPDDADWDPADIRYATVRWFVTEGGAYAIGPSRVNPWTGQIYDADIGFSESMVRFTRSEFREFVDPVTTMAALLPDETDAPASAGAINRLAGRADPRFRCNIGMGALLEARFGRDLLAARGMQPGSPAEQQYVNDFLVSVTAHEVGHTLGLRHNFRASVLQPVDQLQNATRTVQQGLTASVMDYTPVNIAGPGQHQGQHWQTTLGPYDDWAIAYSYSVFPGIKKPEDELPELKKIAARVADASVPYGTDEDMSDPRTSAWDIGGDPLAYYEQRMSLVRELWQTIPSAMAREGEGYQVMRRAFTSGLFELIPASANATKFIGGIYSHRDHVGDPQGRLPLQVVPADRQREALGFLTKHLFSSTPFNVPADLLSKLAADRWWDFSGSVFRMQRLEFPLHDVVLQAQQMILTRLYRPVQLDRLVDMEQLFPAGQKPFTLPEMFDGLQKAIWSELYAGGAPKIDSFRRGVQREHLKKLIDLTIKPDRDAPEDAATYARANLTELLGKIDAALKTGAVEAGTRAHLEETKARIQMALSAQMLRLSS